MNFIIMTGCKIKSWLLVERELQGVFSRWRAEILAAMDANIGEAA